MQMQEAYYDRISLTMSKLWGIKDAHYILEPGSFCFFRFIARKER